MARNTRMILAAHLPKEPGGPVDHNYLMNAKRVTAEQFGAHIRVASLEGRLVYVITQSTGFGWRTVWEISHA